MAGTQGPAPLAGQWQLETLVLNVGCLSSGQSPG